MDVAGYSNAFAPITPDDHRGPIWIVTLTGLFSATLIVVLRFLIKRSTLSYDDYTMAASTVIGVIQSAILLAGLQEGLGKSFYLISPNHASPAGKIFLTCQAFYILTVGFSKCALALSTRRIFAANMTKHLGLSTAIIALSILWTLGSICGITIDCFAPSLLTPKVYKSCPNQTIRWIAIATIDAILELALVAVPMMTILPLQMKKGLKVTIMISLGGRLFCIVLVGLHAQYFGGGLQSGNPGIHVADMLALQQVHMNYALMSASLPVLNGFLKGFHTQDMMKVGFNNRKYGSSRDKNTFEMQVYTGTGKNMASVIGRGEPPENVSQIGYSVSVGRRERDPSIGSRMSQDPIIKHTVEYNITYEDAVAGERSTSPSTHETVCEV